MVLLWFQDVDALELSTGVLDRILDFQGLQMCHFPIQLKQDC